MSQSSSLQRSDHRSIRRDFPTATQASSLADILERVLDKGIVIAGDISVSVASTELLNIRIRLLISSVDKAREMGINWWEGDPYLSNKAAQLELENRQLNDRLAALESELRSLKALEPVAATSATPELEVVEDS
ncbi:MAG: gas vesicle protein [Prochlorotrichaceae cyanobacterium]